MTQAQPLGARLRAVGVLALAPALALLAPSPSTTWASQDPTAPLVAGVAVLAWALTGWLLLVVAATCVGRLPGVLGLPARRLAVRVAPASVRGLVRVALGTTVTLSVLGGSSAFAATAPVASSSWDWPGVTVRASPAPSAALDWPGTAPAVTPTTPEASPSPAAAPSHVIRPDSTPPGPVVGPVVEPVVGPTTTPAATPAAAAGRQAVHRAGDVVVHAGDSLWSLAAADLGATATPAQVAQAWPQWWSANRALIGDHPELIHPGDHLTPPSAP